MTVVLSDEYLDETVEKMREAVRELRKIHGERTVVERCQDLLTEAAKRFREVRDDYKDLSAKLADAQKMLEQQTVRVGHFDELIEMVMDMQRGMRSTFELYDYAKEHKQ